MRTRDVICCISRIIVAVSVRGRSPPPPPPPPPPRAPPRRGRFEGDASAGDEGDRPSPYVCKCEVLVDRPRGARNGVWPVGGGGDGNGSALMGGRETLLGEMDVGGEGMRLVRRMRAGKGVGSTTGSEEEGGDDGSGDGVRRCRVEFASAADSTGGGGGGGGDVGRVARVGTVFAAAAAVGAFSAVSACERVTSNSSLTSACESAVRTASSWILLISEHPATATHLALRPLIAGLLPRAGLSRRVPLRGGRSVRAPCCTASRGSAATSPSPCACEIVSEHSRLAR